MNLILIAAAVCAILAVIFMVIYKKTESKDAING